MPFLTPVTLRGDLVELRPLATSDHDALVHAATDGDVWRLPYTRVPGPEQMAAEIARRLALAERGEMLPFTTVRLGGPGGGPDGEAVIGMTTCCNVDATHRRLEIGYTWNAVSAQRSGTNTESKLLLLGHAFEALGCIAVELRTDLRNVRSQAAIERLGAQRDGVLRHHAVMPDGYVRDTVVYSITAPEWPVVRDGLRARLDRAAAGSTE
ncbi:GNAT family N-acetyltransferase [Serinibacter arcticus]|uniref:N-acetylglutamate synthase related protein n=1 Tax=Serinibacter arcticus TaxID=1655435 RepID=A0A4Z1E007_9MICO|nr:GNAT family protein [Serinibacter arcticus]TGO05224.1 N-acetylglutamate synthase related protein [Serinibacter arcticus]